ncbi:MAG: DinB family protein [Vicinamibacterales bacterium]
MPHDPLRAHLVRLLTWHDAHVSFDDAVRNLEGPLRGVTPPGLPHSVWQLVEHVRIAQADILDFCRNPHYAELEWPDDYWPASAEPPDDGAWDASLAACAADRAALVAMAEDPRVDLSAAIPHGTGQTWLREFLLVADHNAYHVGQIVLVRQLLGAWPAS